MAYVVVRSKVQVVVDVEQAVQAEGRGALEQRLLGSLNLRPQPCCASGAGQYKTPRGFPWSEAGEDKIRRGFPWFTDPGAFEE